MYLVKSSVPHLRPNFQQKEAKYDVQYVIYKLKYVDWKILHCMGRGFINVFFITRATGVHRWAKCFELNFFITKTFLLMVKPAGQNSFHSCSI